MRRSKGYQDLDEGPAPRTSAPALPPPAQEIEMASVSVVPDGKYSLFFSIYVIYFIIKFSLYTNLGLYSVKV